MTIAFFGGEPGAPRRVILLPSLLANVRSPMHADAWVALGFDFCALPQIARRVWWWMALTLLTTSNKISDCLQRFAPALRRSAIDAQSWIDATETTRNFECRIDGQLLAQWSGALFGHMAEPFRSGGIRFGVAADGKSDLAFCIDPDAIPELIEDWSEFVARYGGVPDGVLVAFRQLVLIHPFRDGNGRLARMVVAHLTESCGLPRFLMMPALALFRARSSSDRAAYSTAFASSDASVFNRFVLDRTACLVAEMRRHVWRLQRAVADCPVAASAGSFQSVLNRRLLEWPVVALDELARIGRCSSRNAQRWCETYANSAGFTFDGTQLVWRSLLDELDQIEPDFWAPAQESA